MGRIRSYHFLLVIVIVLTSAYVMGMNQLDNSPIAEEGEKLEELAPAYYLDIISQNKTSAILIYDEDSGLCSKMEYRIYKSEIKNQIETYKMEVKNYPGIEGISGVPTLIFFENGREKLRVVGIIPDKNIKMISNRLKSL